tara:strand:- start:7173 stop:12146 length:4974 start_codon:yes stop_codon:yes gene_type:complete
MGPSKSGVFPAIALVTLFILSVQSYMFTENTEDYSQLYESYIDSSTPIGQSTTVSIGSFPDGAVEKVSVSVPNGEVVQSLGLDIESATLPTSTAFSITKSLDFSSSQYFSGVDVNGSSLSLLPQEWKWDFESGSFSSDWAQCSSSCWAIQSSNALVGSQTAKAATITHNQVTSMTLDVSSLPAGTGTFNYQVSSESSFDYLNFCIDNTGCSRYSYTNQWSGSPSGVHTFSINPSTTTLTWAYSKDGSVNSGSDTAWVDEIVITPAGGAGNGDGYWMSEPFGPSSIGQGEIRNYGLMYIDAFIPNDAVFEWDLIDANTNQTIPGFEKMTSTSIDLGSIDYEEHPELKFYVYMETTSGSLPIIHGIHFEGLIIDSLDSNPVDSGWVLQTSNWNSGQVSGSGTATSPVYSMSSGFVGIKSNSSITGSARMEYSVDSGQTWNILPNNAFQSLSKPEFSAQLRVFGTGGNWVFENLDVEFIRGSIADGLEVDIGLDGIADWSMDKTGVGRLGIQDRFSDNSLSKEMASSPSIPASFTMLMPSKGLESFSFFVSSPSTEMISPYMTISIAGQDILTKNLGNFKSVENIILSSSDLSSLNSVLAQSVTSVNLNGLNFADVTIKIGSSSTATNVHVSGLMAVYDDSLTLDFTATDNLVIAMNSALQSKISVSGYKDISLPIRMKGTGSISLTINGITSQASVIPVNLEVANVTDTFTPSVDWIDVVSTFDFSGIGISNPGDHARSNSWLIDLNLAGQNHNSLIRCPIITLPINGIAISSCVETGMNLVWNNLGQGGEISMIESGTILQFTHRFKFPVDWNDEESLVVSANLVSNSGPMLPVSKSFGLGNSNGVENDISLNHWSVVGSNGIGSNNNYPYLKSGEPVNVNVELGFEGSEESSPRTGQVLVRLLVEGNEYSTSTIINDGIVTLPWVVPTTGSNVLVEVELMPLKGQSVSYQVPNSANFGFDSISPELLFMNIDQFDHVEASPKTTLQFTITDRPVLPTHAEIYYWNSWEHDINSDGEFQLGEVQNSLLSIPEDLSSLQGDYGFDLDTSNADDGSYSFGWIKIADTAGNLLENSGSFESPLFNLQISSDGSPQLGYDSLSWNLGPETWLHPGELVSLEIPIWDKNGVTDISHIELDLSFNQPDDSTISWSRSGNSCESSTLYISIQSCRIESGTDQNIFSSNGKFIVEFILEWGFDPDDSIYRKTSIYLEDLNGQSSQLALNELDWRFSGEMAIDKETLIFTVGDDTLSGDASWVQPRENINVIGEISWAKTQRRVNQPLDLLFEIGGNQAQVDFVNGTFNGTIISPIIPNSYFFEISLRNSPNGASIRQPVNPLMWFVVDDVSPEMVRIITPEINQLIFESTWSEMDIELIISEDEYLNSDSLVLNWEVHPSGFGMLTNSLVNGSSQLQLLGGQPFGQSIPMFVSLDLQSVIDDEAKKQALELRVWITGTDMAGQPISPEFNAKDAPFGIWQLEQQIPEFQFLNPDISPSKELAVGDNVELAVAIQNIGEASGFAQLVVERVESNGARTRIHAQEIELQSGGTGVFTHSWSPDREGSMWIEFVIINGPTSQTDTFYVEDSSSDGFLGGFSEINPILLVIIFVFTVALIGLLIFGLRQPQKQIQRPQGAQKNLPRIKQNQTAAYASQQHANSPGENPYQ